MRKYTERFLFWAIVFAFSVGWWSGHHRGFNQGVRDTAQTLIDEIDNMDREAGFTNL